MKHLNDTLSSMIAHENKTGLIKLSALVDRKRDRAMELLDQDGRGKYHVQDVRNARSIQVESDQVKFALNIISQKEPCEQ